MEIIIMKNLCPQNHPCPSISVCSVGAITQNGFDAPTIDQEKCIKCMKCVEFCLVGVIQAKE